MRPVTGSVDTQALQSLIPPGGAIAVWGQDIVEDTLFPVERDAIKGAIASRRLEFARGRACARAALAQLGVPPSATSGGEHREPVWPRGFVGSISHCEDLVLAVVAPSARVAAVGIDAERAGPLPDDARSEVLRPHEMQANPRHPWPEKLVFSAKESVHKALFPLGRLWMDFLDVEVELDLVRGTFSARPAPEAVQTDRRLPQLHGRLCALDTHVITSSYLDAEG